jgi:hypothetical protein
LLAEKAQQFLRQQRRLRPLGHLGGL